MAVINLTNNTSKANKNVINLTNTPSGKNANKKALNSNSKKKTVSSASSLESGEIPTSKTNKKNEAKKNEKKKNEKKNTNNKTKHVQTKKQEKKRRRNSPVKENGQINVPVRSDYGLTSKYNTYRLSRSPPYKTEETIALPESRTPVMKEKYKDMKLDANSLFHAYHASTNNINTSLQWKLYHLIGDTTQHAANVVGRGLMSSVWKETYHPKGLLNDTFKLIEEHQKGKDKPLTRIFERPLEGSTVAIKSQRLKNTDKPKKVAQQVKELNNETLIMKELQGLPFVPKLYATVYDKKLHRYFFFMEYIQGKTLGTILLEGGSVRRLENIYKSLNKALIQMWKRGVTHMDLHRDNIIVLDSANKSENAGKKIKIIDFGLAHKTKRVENIAAKYKNSNNAWLRWQNNLKRYANALTIKSNYKFYNPNAKILAVLHDLLTKHKRKT